MASAGVRESVRFQSTLSVRRATSTFEQAEHRWDISIHALRKESDRWILDPDHKKMSIFQSTLSVRRATVQLDIFVHFLRRKPAAWL